ncbi:MAG: M56 family metallopeptidase [Actinomycetota bacterium]
MMVELIDRFQSIEATWGPSLWRACWQGGIVIGVIFAASRLLPRLSPSVRDSLWRFAHLKLVVALFWTTPLIIPILPAGPADVGTAGIPAWEAAGAPFGVTAPTPGEVAQPFEVGAVKPTPSPSPPTAPATTASWKLTTALLAAWAMGVIGYGVLVASGLRAAAGLRAACKPLSDPELLATYADLCEAHSIRRPPQLLETGRAMSPLLTGILAPVIVLPSRLLTECSRDELRLVLMHELAHLRRGDLLWSWLPVMTRLLFFFHPLVWVAEREWRDAQETACDAAAIDAAGVGVAEYASVLLKVAAICRPDPAGATPALGITESFRTLKRRLVAMESVRQRAPRSLAVAGAALMVMSVVGIVPWQLGSRPVSAGDAPSAALPTVRPAIFDFEKDTQGWFSRLPGAAISVSRKPDTTKVGNGSLEWAYNPNLPNATLVRSQPQLPASAASVAFWMRSSASGAFQLYLVEGDGSVYHLHMRPSAGVWRHYQVPLTDLMQGEREDANGRLDLDQVTEIVLQDLSVHHSGGTRLEGRKVWLDGFNLTEAEAPSRRPLRAIAEGGRELLIDDFQLPALTWAGNTNAKLTLADTDGRGVLRARYRPGSNSPSRFQITNHFDARYARAKAVRVVARASRPTNLAIALREFDGTFTGPEYTATCQLTGTRKWETFVLPVSRFRLTTQPTATRRGLDPARVWLMLVGDVTEASDASETELEIDSISAQLTE